MALDAREQVLVDEALVVAEVEVGLPAVVGDEDLAVLERVHRPRIDVDVRIELLQRHAETTELEQPAQRGRRETLAERAGHPACHEDVLRHGISAYRVRERETVTVAGKGSSRWMFERNGNAVASLLFALAGLLGVRGDPRTDRHRARLPRPQPDPAEWTTGDRYGQRRHRHRRRRLRRADPPRRHVTAQRASSSQGVTAGGLAALVAGQHPRQLANAVVVGRRRSRSPS